MNPNRVEGPSGPAPEAPPPGSHENVPSGGGEVINASPESAPSKQSAPTMHIPSDLPQAAPVTLPTASDDDDLKTAAPSDASDGDRIERQWVDKAKTVASSTKDDPYTQKNEMSKVKADYIKSRFNKTIRIDGEAA